MRATLLITTALFATSPAFARYEPTNVNGVTLMCEPLPEGGVYCDPPHAPPPPHVANEQDTEDLQRLLRRITSEHRPPPRPAYVPRPVYVAPIPAPDPEPSVDLPYDAPMHEYLRAALAAIHEQDATTADEALQRAETRILSRSVPLGATDMPIRGRTDATIRRARQAVASEDWDGAARLVDEALRHRGGRQAMERPINYP